ncbi:MAG TPA: hypothetical protein PK867_20120 [Pirellulales bacterium]|nr:hypothetical protein [Pirellulales bacterium]
MWASVEPVVIHGVVVVVLVLCAIIAALLVHLLAIVSRGQERLVEFFDRLDLVAVILFLCIFCAHGAIMLLIQVCDEISDKWNRRDRG